MLSVDDHSYHSGRSYTSTNSNNGFSIDWDEIDSIAEESLSVASSVSSGHRKRKNSSSRRRTNRDQQLEALESGSLGRTYVSSSSYSKPSNSSSSKSSPSINSAASSSSVNKQKRPSSKKKMLRKTIQKIQRLGSICLVSLLTIIGIHQITGMLSSASGYATHSATAYYALSGGSGGDRQMRRALSRSTATYQARHWPISVRDEQDDFEHFPHPANDKITLSLPPFFLTKEDGSMQALGVAKTTNAAAPASSTKGFDRKMADMVGRTTVDGSRDFSVRTIFISVTSYRDWHCRYTVESIFSRAKYPERLRVGVVDQIENGQDQSCDLPIVPCSQKQNQALCQFRDQIDVYEMESTLAVGPPFARHVSSRLYRGEYYALQVDSHTAFVKNWDVDLIEQLEATGNEMAVLTTYLDDAQGSIEEDTGRLLTKSRQVLCNAVYEGTGLERRLRHDQEQQPNTLSRIHGMPQLQPYWSASFSFSRGHFILSVPYDPYLPMVQREDEEISMALRGFTHGYDYYAPETPVAFDSAFNDRDSRKSFLEHKNLYKGMQKTSLLRLYGIVGLDNNAEPSDWTSDPDELFAIGNARPLSKFFASFGVHARERITEHKLCDFVTTGRMHKLFHEHLREDGMGLDYNSIHFRFHELQNNHDGGS